MLNTLWNVINLKSTIYKNTINNLNILTKIIAVNDATEKLQRSPVNPYSFRIVILNAIIGNINTINEWNTPVTTHPK
jgi:hypothetical protein